MTAVQLMIEFNRLAESVYRIYDTQDRLNPWDIEGYINKAQDQMIKERFLSYQTPYENVVALNESYDEISPLIDVATGLSPTQAESGYGSYSKVIVPPDNYLYYVRSSTKVTREKINQVTDEWAENQVIGLRSLLRSISGAGNYPIIDNPLVYLANSKVYILHDAYTTVNGFNLMYLKEPSDLDLNTDNECELPGHWHYSLADYAVRLYLGNQKYEAQKSEE